MDSQHHPPNPSPVHFENRLAVRTFFLDRVAQLGMTVRSVAAQFGNEHSGPVRQMFRGRHLFSRSKYFEPLCDLLQITAEERAAIWRAERSRR